MAKLVKVNEVCDLLGIGEGMGYKVIRDLNAELRNKGFITIQGRIPIDYVRERFGLVENEVNNENN